MCGCKRVSVLLANFCYHFVWVLLQPLTFWMYVFLFYIFYLYQTLASNTLELHFGCAFSLFPAQDWHPLATSIIARWCQCVVADFRTISGTEFREPRQGKYHETSVKYRKIVAGRREMHFNPASRISATCTLGILCLRALIRWSYARLLSAYFKILY